MNTHRLVISILLSVNIAACQAGGGPAKPAAVATMPIRVAYRSSQCLSETANIEQIQNANALARWWQPFARQQLPAKPLPQGLAAIDFDQSTVIVVFMGPRPSAGYGIELQDDRAAVQRASLTIPASWREPARGAMVAQVMTSPCIAFVVPAARYESVTVRDRHGKILLQTPP